MATRKSFNKPLRTEQVSKSDYESLFNALFASEVADCSCPEDRDELFICDVPAFISTVAGVEIAPLVNIAKYVAGIELPVIVISKQVAKQTVLPIVNISKAVRAEGSVIVNLAKIVSTNG